MLRNGMADAKRVELAAAKLKQGGFCVIYDGDEREGEADLVFHASFAAPERIERMRRDAGGLICLSLDKAIGERLGLPFYTDILAASNLPIAKMECKKAAYGDKPAFSIPVNHKGVYTGITDSDRALTIRSMAELVGAGVPDIRERFMREFYSPGHVFLLIGRGIEKRRGHTELTLELARRAGMSGAMVLCEMLGSGNALPKDKVKEYAKEHGLAFVEGRDF
jgi:3,4-dihydroxy 2-butanone 4-phosphate synthase